MRKVFALLVVFGAVSCAVQSLAQGGAVAITPAKVTMLVGETHEFKAVDAEGHSLRNISWSISDPAIAQLTSGDEAQLTATHPGRLTVTANTSEGRADALVEVLEGSTMPTGTIKWSGGDFPGCHTTKLIPAVPSPSGVDIFEQSECPDGGYVSAFTADGILVWRRKISSNLQPAAAASPAAEVRPESFDPGVASICDAVSVGMKREAVSEVLKARNLQASGPQGSWVIEEDGSDCHLWFDAKSQVLKKRKTLTTE